MLQKNIQNVKSVDVDFNAAKKFIRKINHIGLFILREVIFKTGGLWAANIVDIYLSGTVWSIILSTGVGKTGGLVLGYLISLAMTRAQIYLLDRLSKLKTQRIEPEEVMYLSVMLFLMVLDTLIDITILAYYLYDVSPLDYFTFVMSRPMGVMFWVFTTMIAIFSLAGDIFNIIFYTESEENVKSTIGANSYQSKYSARRPRNFNQSGRVTGRNGSSTFTTSPRGATTKDIQGDFTDLWKSD